MGTTRKFFLHCLFEWSNLFSFLFIYLIAERDRLKKDLELAHSAIKQLEAELENLQVGYGRQPDDELLLP